MRQNSFYCQNGGAYIIHKESDRVTYEYAAVCAEHLPKLIARMSRRFPEQMKTADRMAIVVSHVNGQNRVCEF